MRDKDDPLLAGDRGKPFRKLPVFVLNGQTVYFIFGFFAFLYDFILN
jgi:hypothetical protein